MIILYCAVRLTVNITATYLPFYLQDTLKLDKKFVSIIPLVQFIFGFLISFSMEKVSSKIGKTGTFLFGCLSMLLASIVIFSVDLGEQVEVLVFVSVLIGIGTSVMLIQVLAIAAELISSDESSSGFVYGFLSFIEKIVNGGVIMLIQVGFEKMKSCPIHAHLIDQFYMYLLALGVGAVVIICAFTAVVHWWLGIKKKTGENEI